MSKRSALIVVGSCLVLLVLLMAAAVALNNREVSDIKARSSLITATVTGKTKEKIGWRSGSGDIIENCVSLSFHRADGGASSKTTCYHVWDQDYAPLEVGAQVAAYYDPTTDEVYLAAALAH